MTLPRLAVLNRYWRKCPPPHLLLAALAGYKPPPDEQPAEDMHQLVAWFKATGGRL